jgi:hypothetical protein
VKQILEWSVTDHNNYIYENSITELFETVVLAFYNINNRFLYIDI